MDKKHRSVNTRPQSLNDQLLGDDRNLESDLIHERRCNLQWPSTISKVTHVLLADSVDKFG